MTSEHNKLCVCVCDQTNKGKVQIPASEINFMIQKVNNVSKDFEV